MKQGWEYKKLGEVAEIVGGSTPKTNVEEYWDGDHFWVTPAELKGDRFIISTSRTITDLAVESTNLSLLPKGTVLLSSRAPIGKVAITDVPMYCNQGFKNIICGEKLNNNYIYWLLYGKTEYLNSLGVGATFKEISKKIVENITIPVPPLPTQQAIVSELDTLSGIIAECKETLKDYDALEQSIFYDMFGDPVKNDKGWEVKKLGDICKVGTGSTPDRKNERFYEGYIPWVKSTEVCNLVINNTQEHISQEAYDSSNCSLYPKGSILMAMYGQGKTRGQVGILGIEACTNQAVAAIILPDNIATTFLFVQLQLMYNYIRGMANGCNQTNLNVGIVKSIVIICPPLPLQQSFATKIEAIEQMKAETKEALQEAETLFQARMDYWFN